MTTPEPNVPPVLNQPKSSTGRTSLTTRCVTVGISSCLLSFLTVMAVTFSLPRIFEGHTLIAISTVSKTPGQQQPGIGVRDQSALLQTHAQRLKNEAVLLQVAKEEMLVAKWGIAGTKEAATQQCVGLLNLRVEAQPVNGTKLIQIVSYSTDPKEAADVANRVAKVYGDILRQENKGEVVEISKVATSPATHSKPNVPLYLGVGFLGAATLGAMASGLVFLVGRASATRRKQLAMISGGAMILLTFGREFVKSIEDKPKPGASHPIPAPKPNEAAASDYLKQAFAKLEKGDLDGAIANSSRAIELDRRNADAYVDRGIARYKKGDFDGSMADLNRAVELVPKYAVAYGWRGLDKFKKHDYDGAIDDYNQAAKLDPKEAVNLNWSYVEAYFCRGEGKLEKDRLDDAIEDFTRVLERDPKVFTAYKARSWAYARKGDYNRAWAEVKKCRELGGSMNDEFIKALSKASGRTE